MAGKVIRHAGKVEDADRFRAFYNEYLAVLDMPAEFYLETIERMFKNHEMARGVITYQGDPVNLEAIDDICGPGQTEAAQDICANIPKGWR